jgi:rubrerythrin
MEKETILAGLDPEVMDEVTSRRGALLGMGRMGARLALASAPLAVAVMARQAFAQTTLPANIAAVLNFALILEELESEFYTIATGGMGMSGGAVVTNLIPSRDRQIFDTIRDHEQAHVRFLRETLGSQAVAKPTFDFTAGGAFGDVFTNYATFLTLAQAFEDTGVRAYKGQAPNLFANKDVLEAALRIHSVEARHASEVRRLRGNFSEQAPQKGWITGNQSGGAPAAVYAGEENVQQGAPPAPAPGINVATLPGVTGASVNPAVAAATAASEAFDEPLTRAQVVAIIDPFVVEPIS